MVQGQWNIGGFNLPDFGVTEALHLGTPNPAVTGQASYQAPQQQQSFGPQPVYGPAKPSGSVLGASTSNLPTNNIPQGNTPQQTVQGNQDQGNAQIEADYSAAMGQLNNSESDLRGQAGYATGQIDTGATAARNEIGNNQTVAEQGANTSLQTAEKQGTGAMQQARDLFRQTQQSNTAQLSAMGISSSSVSEALAEKLGVETARRIAGVTGSLDEVRQNTVNELGRIKTYYTGKMTDLTNQVNDQKTQIQNSLMQGLNQINSARDMAAQQKSQARAGLLSAVQNQLGSLAQQQQQFQQSLEAWQAQKTAALQPIAQDPNYLNNLISTANTFNQQFAPSGFTYTPQVNVNAQGTMTGQVSPQKKPDDQLTNPFLTQ